MVSASVAISFRTPNSATLGWSGGSSPRGPARRRSPAGRPVIRPEAADGYPYDLLECEANNRCDAIVPIGVDLPTTGFEYWLKPTGPIARHSPTRNCHRAVHDRIGSDTVDVANPSRTVIALLQLGRNTDHDVPQ